MLSNIILLYNGLDLREIDKSIKILNYLEDGSNIFIVDCSLTGGFLMEKQINIKFIKLPRRILDKNIYNCNLFGLLKLCLLKEISTKIDNNQIAQLPIILS